MLKSVFSVGFGGALGAVSRYGVDYAMTQWKGRNFPYGTMTVNLLGCFLIGYLATRLEQHPSAYFKLAVLTGFLGSFTTYSTFGLDTFKLIRGDQGVLGITYVGIHLLVGLGAVVLGTRLAR